MSHKYILITIDNFNFNDLTLIKYKNYEEIMFDWNLDSDDKTNNLFIKDNCIYEDLYYLKHIELVIQNFINPTSNSEINIEELINMSKKLLIEIEDREAFYSSDHEEVVYVYEKLYKKLRKIIKNTLLFCDQYESFK